MSDAILQKLNYKEQDPVLLVNAPAEFSPIREAWKKRTKIDVKPVARTRYAFAMVFVLTDADIVHTSTAITASLADDAVFWMVYPKKSSQRYQTTINRDHGWAPLGAQQFEPVRLVAIDEDWSALRFRKVEHIAKMIRRQSMTLSDAGKKKTVNKSSKAIRPPKA